MSSDGFTHRQWPRAPRNSFLWRLNINKKIVKQRVYVQESDQQLDDSFEGGNKIPHKNVYIQKTNLQKTLEIMEIQRRELLNYTKEV